MKKFYFIILFFVFGVFKGFGQYEILCPSDFMWIKIDNPVNIPTATENNDGTITLTHIEQYITDIFANYVIYGFVQTFPSGNAETQKIYTLTYENNSLISELQAVVPNDVFLFDETLITTPITPELITLLDGNSLTLLSYRSTDDSDDEPTINVPNDIVFTLNFSYDESNDVLFAESDGLTPCGNSFTIGFKGGSVSGTLQPWLTTPGISSITTFEDYPCHQIEFTIYEMLDLACHEICYGDLNLQINYAENEIFMDRYNMVFGFHEATFSFEALSTEKFSENNIRLYETEGNPYLQVSFLENLSLTATIYSASGVLIQNKLPLTNNSILINQLPSGIYFIHVMDSNSQSKMYKFLKK